MNMGKVLGGGSSINVIVWARGHKNDRENFAKDADDQHGATSRCRRSIGVSSWQGVEDPVRRGMQARHSYGRCSVASRCGEPSA